MPKTPPPPTVEEALDELQNLLSLEQVRIAAGQRRKAFDSGVYDPALKLIAAGWNSGVLKSITVGIGDVLADRGMIERLEFGKPVRRKR